MGDGRMRQLRLHECARPVIACEIAPRLFAKRPPWGKFNDGRSPRACTLRWGIVRLAGTRLRDEFAVRRSIGHATSARAPRPAAARLAHRRCHAGADLSRAAVPARARPLLRAKRTAIERSSRGGRAVAGESLSRGANPRSDAGVRRVTHKSHWTHQSHRTYWIHSAHRRAELETGGRLSRPVSHDPGAGRLYS
jgi:hypothetical protein